MSSLISMKERNKKVVMEWEKKGLIYCPNGENVWEQHSFMTPHAMLVEPDIIRIWGGVRNAEGVSRIKYIDVRADNPGEVLYVSDKPVIDIGNKGCFDDNGMILGDIVTVGNKLYMYYAGFQHVQKVKFFAFTGLAISSDGGKNFERYSETPVLDRNTNARFGRCVHTVLYDKGIFRAYYAIINDWKIISGIPYPIYNIWTTESQDGIHFPEEDKYLCVDVTGDEYRIGRPKVYRVGNGYEMYYTRDTINKEYLAGYAVSDDGIKWTRKDSEIGLHKSMDGWDSEMACYPVKLTVRDNTYLFYNGNGQGKSGVGYAIMKK